VSEPAADSEASAVGDALDVARGPSIVIDAQRRVRAISPAARRLVPGCRIGHGLGRAVALGDAALASLTGGQPVEVAVDGASLRLRATELGEAASRSGWLVTVDELPPAAARGAVCFHGMWTQDAALKQIFRVVEKVAVDDATVLIRGETGTGKELVAQAIHVVSPRRRGPFRAINCAALPATLLESELFGHMRGAFTGAVRDSVGLMASADGGTLFLDEVAEMPLELQAKLLRVLETRTVLPVGGRDPVPVDVRVLSATHRALRKETEAGRFRRDLLYRLRVIPVFLPPLRERRGDIALLCDRLVAEMTPRSRRRVERVAPAAIEVLDRHDWPGNVRELRNVLAYAYAIGDGPVIVPEDLPPELLGAAPPEVEPPAEAVVARRPDAPDARRIVDALARAGGNRERAAQSLGMSRVTLWRHMRQLGISTGR
jgi:two-component system response regulator AtoC